MNSVINLVTKYGIITYLLLALTVILGFSDYIADLPYFFAGFLVFLIYIGLVNFVGLDATSNGRGFERKLFIVSTIVNFVVIVVLYFFYDMITNTPFSPDAVDELYYHDIGLQIAESLKEGNWGLDVTLIGRFDDVGFPYIKGIIYYLTGGSWFVFRLIQGLMLTITGILSFRISIYLYDNLSVAKLVAALVTFFPMFLVFTTLHLKEISFIFLIVIIAYALLKYENNILMLLIAVSVPITILLNLRGALAASLMFSIVVHLILSDYKRLFNLRGLFIVILLSVTIIYILYALNISQEFLGYFERRASVGESQIERISSFNKSAFYSFPLFLTLVLEAPFPTMVYTNIRFFDQTFQWWHIGGVFVWNILSFFSLVGIYLTFKHRIKKSVFLLIGGFSYSIILAFTALFTAIRYQMPSKIFLLFFAGYGIYAVANNFPKYRLKMFVYYALVFLLLFLWNYFKLLGRGYI